MKEKILAQLIAKNKGVSKFLLGLLAGKIAATVTEEAEIETAISEFETNSPLSIKEMADAFQKEGDHRVTTAQKKPAKQEGSEEPEKPAKPGSDDNPLAKQIEQLTQTVAGLQKSLVTKSLSESLNAKLKEKKIPLALAKGRSIESEDQLDQIVEEIETDYTELKQELTNQGFANQQKPFAGLPSGADSKAAIEADIKSWAQDREAEITKAS
ncbi:MAG TPA: hypothetical protein PL085_11575 [Agriterribacter sp.]|uniref:hypothetical protein n=1 Tax=Agriterribacter sp. TaxID=2821509 RepID=UPI002BCF8301|nr:hypothetical protein [Agriterribacter sp.]HRQ17709.1 hypothetical protein [Agriterribacter sp.]